MKRPSRITIVHASFLLLASAITVKAAFVQLWQAGQWEKVARQQHTTSQIIPAPRGTIFDATGTVLVESRPLITLAIAPNEVAKADRSLLAKELKRAKVSQETIKRAMDTTRQWVPVAGRFLSSDVAGVLAFRGVHTAPALERVASPLPGLAGVIGHAASDTGVDGVELALDSLLRGTAGRSAFVRNGRNKKMLSPEVQGRDAVAGNSVTLTIRLDLQGIAEQALSNAVRSTHSRGGDVVVLDPRSGDLLALASRRDDPRASTATALTEPVEPGSTLKPFVAAALLEKKRVGINEVFDTHNGVWEFQGFPLTDAHKAPQLTFRQIIEYSSNIGMAQAAMRLTPKEEYEILRDFGFGAPTGLPFPSEASGVLRDPSKWTATSQASLARGYEMMATPVQLAMAYGAIANGGELLAPGLIREIRDPKGTVVYKRERQVVRRVISKGIAEQMRNVLRLVVDSGTATKADLASYEVGGKSGTARRAVHGTYVKGEYTATFVGLFPADDPQMVVLVKLDSPDAAGYYGGVVAAPVMKAVVEAALASSDEVFDRGRLKQKARPAAPAATVAAEDEPRDAEVGEVDTGGSTTIVMSVPARKAEPVRLAPGVVRTVPDVAGMSIRSAATTLHRAGFRVRVTRGGSRGATVPAAGASARPGALISLQNGQ